MCLIHVGMSPSIILEVVKMSKHYIVAAESELRMRRRWQSDWGRSVFGKDLAVHAQFCSSWLKESTVEKEA